MPGAVIEYSHLVQAIGGLFLLDLLACLAFFREAFPCGRKSADSRDGEALRWIIGLAWLAGAALLLSGRPPLFLAGAVLLLAGFRRHFISSRWTSPRRGFGAPGFMSHFAVLYLVVFEVARALDPSGKLLDLAFLVFRVDFAVIMICAGVYKGLVGFYRGEGMEYGSVNPIWGYHWRQLSRIAPGSWYFRLNNILASSVEVFAGVLMLFPATRIVGAVLIAASFLYIALLIRLGRLAFLMVLLPAFYLPSVLESAHGAAPAFLVRGSEWLVPVAAAALWAFLVMIPLVKVVQYLNLFGNRRLPEPWQKWITAYANFVPIIMWRVFTPDVTNFYFRIRGRAPGDASARVLVDESTYRWRGWKNLVPWLRFSHVGESIALVSVFTLRKYYPSRPELFRGRLLEYADSLRGTFGLELREFEFECVAIRKSPGRFVFEPVRRFLVDLKERRIEEEEILADDPTSKPARFSPVREAASAGTYAARPPSNS